MYEPNKYNEMAQNMAYEPIPNMPMEENVMPGQECAPGQECMPIEKVCHREIHHCVKHVQPVHTRIVNHHIFHHTCVPCFTCSEENVACNVFDNRCCK